MLTIVVHDSHVTVWDHMTVMWLYEITWRSCDCMTASGVTAKPMLLISQQNANSKTSPNSWNIFLGLLFPMNIINPSGPSHCIIADGGTDRLYVNEFICVLCVCIQYICPAEPCTHTVECGHPRDPESWKVSKLLMPAYYCCRCWIYRKMQKI